MNLQGANMPLTDNDRTRLRDELKRRMGYNLPPPVQPVIENIVETPNIVNEAPVIPPIDVAPLAAAIVQACKPVLDAVFAMQAELLRQSRENEKLRATFANGMQKITDAMANIKINVQPATVDMKPAPKREIEIVRTADDKMLVREI